MLPNLRNGQEIKRKVIFGESFAHDIADIYNPEASLLYRWVIEGNIKLLLTYDGRTGKMKFPPEDSEPKLYDLIADPHEEVNLADKKPRMVEMLSKRLDSWYQLKERQQGVPPKSNEKPGVIRE